MNNFFGTITGPSLALLFLLAFSTSTTAISFEEISESELRFEQVTEGFCDIHFKINSSGQRNHAMRPIGPRLCEFIVEGLSPGDRVEFFSTYQQNGLAYDTPWQQITFYEDAPGGSTELIEELSDSELVIRQASEGFCDIHYRINNGGQQNFAMNRNSGVDGLCAYIISNLRPGDQIDFFTTYQIQGLAYDSEWQAYVFAGGQTPGEQSPYLGSAVSLPASIEAENYDFGGQNIAYHDTTVGNSFSQYRSDDVDIRAAASGFVVAMAATQEWLEYTVDVSEGADYELSVSVGANAPSTLRVVFSGASSVAIDIPTQASGQQSFTRSVARRLRLNSGEHLLRLENNGEEIFIDTINIVKVSSPEPTVAPNPTPSPVPTTTPPQPSNLPDAYPGYTGVYNNYQLLIDDRFDFLDAENWTTGDGGFTENDCRFQPQGVQFSNGVMSLVVTQENAPASWSFDQNRWIEGKNYACGELRSKQSLLYGRFEARIRNPSPSVASGYISSLFTYVNDVEGAFKWREIDVEMEGGRPTKFQTNLIFGENTWQWFETRQWGAYETKIEIGPTDQWKVYAIEWTADAIRWYVDGVLLKTLLPGDVDGNPLRPPQIYPANIPRIAQQVMMNFWIPNDLVQDNFGGNKRDNVYPMKAQYDWFRYYRYTP